LKEKEFLAFGYLICLAVVIPWSNALTNLLLAGGVLFIIQNIITNKRTRIKLRAIQKMLLVFGLAFLSLILIKVLISTDYSGLAYLARISTVVYLPAMLYLMAGKIPETQNRKVLQLFIHSVFVLSVGTLAIAVVKTLTRASSPLSMVNLAYREFSGSLVHHEPVYFSIFVGASIVFGCWLLLFDPDKRKNYIYYFEVLFLFIFLFLLGSGTAILATIVCVGIICAIKSRKLLIYSILSFGALFILNYSLNKSFQFKVDDVLNFNTSFDYQGNSSYEGLAIRYGTWKCSIDGIKENLWTGIGISHSQEYLDTCYREKGYQSLTYLMENKGTVFNSHNVYLDVFLKFGLIGFLIFLVLLVLLVMTAIKKWNILLLLMLVFFMIMGATESILVREKGIIFFSFFFGLFLCLNPSKQRMDDQG